jgi:hypothetical protein
MDAEPMQELTLEHQILQELKSLDGKVEGIDRKQELLNVELMGREGAPEHGRLPRLEVGFEEHEKRIKRLENAYFIAGVVVGAMGMKMLAPLADVMIGILKAH